MNKSEHSSSIASTDEACDRPDRAFIAIKLPLDLAATLHKKAIHRAGESLSDDLRWVVPQKQHLTLRYLGESTSEQLEELIRLLEVQLTGTTVFDSMTGCFDFFPDASRPRVLALDMHSGQELKKLARMCESIAVDCGFKREGRNFRPHVTLGRFKKHSHVTHSHFFNMSSFKMTVHEILLMKSERTSEGTRYKTMHVIPLQPLAISA